jgi:putative CocE/NonD family hydrolase
MFVAQVTRREFLQSSSAIAGAAVLATPACLAADKEAAPARSKLCDVSVIRDVMVPMRDGVKLATDLYVPARDGLPVGGKLPAILMRISYDRTKAFVDHMRFFAERGYLAVTQDCRGRFGSEGTFNAFIQEPEDGYDTIEWLAKHERCNGRVGMFGVSYMAWDQYEAAALSPPSLATITPHCGPVNGYKYCQHPGGTLALTLLKWCLTMAATSQEALRDPKIAKAINAMVDDENFLRWAAATPWRRGQTPLALTPQYEDLAFKFFFDNPDYNDFWRVPGLAMDEQMSKFPEVPTLSIIGWYEAYPRSIVESYQALSASKRVGPHYLIAGPWTHANTRPYCGDANFGAVAGDIPGVGSYLEMHHQWFNRSLRDDKSAKVGAPVKVFVMGGGDGRRGEGGRLNHGGAWHTGNVWPPEGSRPIKFYLHEGGGLAREKPNAEASSSTYTYDPRNTISSDGRCEIAYAGAMIKNNYEGIGPRDQIQLVTLPGHGVPGSPIATRTDVLVFETEPLARDLTVAGNCTARLFISSDAPDTDFYVKLIDVYPPSADYPSGYAFPVTDGILRASYRESFSRPVPLEAGKVYELVIPIQPVANKFVAGHRVRVDVASSSFPCYEPNRNTGRPHDRNWRIANNTVHHDATRASSVELGVMS